MRRVRARQRISHLLKINGLALQDMYDNLKKDYRVKKLLLAAGLAALMSSAFAATPPVPKVLEAPVSQGMKVITSFSAVNNLRGWVLQRGEKPFVAYTSADGKFLFVGGLIDEAGKNLTQDYADKFIPKPDYTALFSKLEQSAYFAEGAKGSAVKGTIYAFLDPNCIFCHLAWKAFLPYEKAGLQVRWVPVGFLKADSAGKAAALLEAKDPDAAMAQNENEFVEATESGGIKAVATISPATAKKLAANSQLMGAFGLGGTPAIVYKDKSGKVIVKPGMPRMSDLPGITGIPEQPQTDPALARFK